jgi:hypothetical protein
MIAAPGPLTAATVHDRPGAPSGTDPDRTTGERTTTMTTTYLGLRPAAVIATGLTAVAIGAAIGLATPTPFDRVAPCGLTVEDGVLIPASCASEAELADRLATIRAERSGGRW